jgi:carbon storage regulator
MVGHDIVVTVLEVRGDVVRVGIKAPREVQVHREEVYVELQQANQASVTPSEAAVDALASRLRGGSSNPTAAPSPGGAESSRDGRATPSPDA